MCSFVRSFLGLAVEGLAVGRTAGRPDGSPSDSFSSLWAAFTLTVYINALYNERVHGKEEHAI